jgi:hypothetical protein
LLLHELVALKVWRSPKQNAAFTFYFLLLHLDAFELCFFLSINNGHRSHVGVHMEENNMPRYMQI